MPACHHDVHYMSMTYLFYSRKCVPSDHFCQFCHRLHSLPLRTTSYFSLSMTLCCWGFFHFHLPVRSYSIFLPLSNVFHYPNALVYHPCIVKAGFLLFYSRRMITSMHTPQFLYSFSHRWVWKLFPHLQ